MEVLEEHFKALHKNEEAVYGAVNFGISGLDQLTTTIGILLHTLLKKEMLTEEQMNEITSIRAGTDYQELMASPNVNPAVVAVKLVQSIKRIDFEIAKILEFLVGKGVMTKEEWTNVVAEAGAAQEKALEAAKEEQRKKALSKEEFSRVHDS